jgi:hypothetical protein
MRVLVRFSVPTEFGNELIRSGKLGGHMQSIMNDLKPECFYAFPSVTAGLRSGILVVNLQDASEIAGIVERFSFAFHANVTITPVMTAEDLEKAMGGFEQIISTFG